MLKCYDLLVLKKQLWDIRLLRRFLECSENLHFIYLPIEAGAEMAGNAVLGSLN